MDKSRACLDYRRSVVVEYAALRMEANLFGYDFTTGRVSGLPAGGRYYGLRIDGLGPRRHLAGFPTVIVTYLTDS